MHGRRIACEVHGEGPAGQEHPGQLLLHRVVDGDHVAENPNVHSIHLTRLHIMSTFEFLLRKFSIEKSFPFQDEIFCDLVT